MKLSEIGEYISNLNIPLIHIRCGQCQRIVVGKDGKEVWFTSIEHTCWKDWNEVKVWSEWLGGHCGMLVTVEKGEEDRNEMSQSEDK